MFFIGITIGVLLFVLWALKDSFFKVEEGQVAVVTRFGAAQRDAGHHLVLQGPGLHFKWPFEEIHRVSLREQLLPLGTDNGSEPMMLNDGTVIRLHSMLRYAPMREGIEQYVFGLHHRKEHIAGLFSSLLRNEVANVKAPSANEEARADNDDGAGAYALVRRDRGLLNKRIGEYATKTLGDEYGVRFEAIDITDIHPPNELAEALNAVMSARSQADSMRFRAQSDSAQKLMSAKQGLEIARTRAKAAQLEIEELGKHLETLEDTGVLSNYVERRRTEVLHDARTVYIKDNLQNGATS